MSAKFTKGPWRIENGGVYGVDGKKVVARGLPLDHGYGGSEADSALILASPLLYEALEDLISYPQDPLLDDRGLDAWRESRERARHALRAARGEG